MALVERTSSENSKLGRLHHLVIGERLGIIPVVAIAARLRGSWSGVLERLSTMAHLFLDDDK